MLTFNRSTPAGRAKSDASRRATRLAFAREQFRPSPVASDFEISFAGRFYAYAEAGGSPKLSRFPTTLRRMRLAVWLAAASVTTTLLAIPIYPAMANQDPPLHWTQNAVAAWLASALLVAVPFTVAIVVSQRRFSRQLQEMNEDRAAYVAHQRASDEADADTERRLNQLGITI